MGTHSHNHPHHGDAGHGHHDHGSGVAGLGRHAHAPASFGRAFAIGIGLNAGFVIVEAGYGIWSNSISLLADAGHNLGDVLGLIVAFTAHHLGQRAPTRRFTYGLRGSSILSALFNAVFLLVIVGGLTWEAVMRLFDPQPVAGTTVMVVASIGIVINGVTALLFAAGRDCDINLKGAYLHMAADALVSAGVVLAGLVMLLTGWLWLDPLTSLVVNAIIVAGTWGLLRDSTSMALQAVPSGIDADGVGRCLRDQPGVSRLHDLHIWPISTTETALTAHLVMPQGHPGDAFLVEVADRLERDFRIAHVTLQIETSADPICRMAHETGACQPVERSAA